MSGTKYTTSFRLIETNIDGARVLTVHEVYFEDGQPADYCPHPTVVDGENQDEVVETMRRIQAAISMPVLLASSFPTIGADQALAAA